MIEIPALPPFSVVIVAAGQGLRAGQSVPKQFANWRGKPVLRHSVERFVDLGARQIAVAIPAGSQALAETVLEGLAVTLVEGGGTRQQSVHAALKALSPCDRVLIHDAARPDIPAAVVGRLLAALEENAGAIPVLPVVDSLVMANDGRMAGSADREILRRVQTPQAFRMPAIAAAHQAWVSEQSAGDDAQVLFAFGEAIGLVEGDEALKKLTFSEDFTMVPPDVRTGMGFDVHRLAAGEELWLGGVKIDHDKGLVGHSDADVAIHALVDALLGAVGDGDIGTHFPPSDPQWKGARSDRFLRHAARIVADKSYRIANVDLTLMCEEPKIGPHRPAMRARLAELLDVDIAQVSVKATTTERLGFTGRGEGIAAQAIATLVRA